MKLPCPRCRSKIDAEAVCCPVCRHDFTPGELNELRFGWWRGMAINIGALALLAYLVFQCSSRPDPSPPAAPLATVDPAQCEKAVAGAETLGLVRERPAANRIDVDERRWALADASDKRALMMSLACVASGGKALPALAINEYAVAYGARSGKRLAMATSAGVSFE